MKILYGNAYNFQSYSALEFHFAQTGLTLIHGATGSGKSTLLDFVRWMLYGSTSKDTKSDDVLKFGSHDRVSGSLLISSPGGDAWIYRSRGKPSENDLHWYYVKSPDELHRGKDIKDSQQQLTQLLGISEESFLMSSYITQFSNSDTFFVSSAKERRENLEKIADLEFSKLLELRIRERAKVKQEELDKAIKSKIKSEAIQGSLWAQQVGIQRDLYRWEAKQRIKIKEAEELIRSFETTKNSELEQLRKKLAIEQKDLEILGKSPPVLYVTVARESLESERGKMLGQLEGLPPPPLCDACGSKLLDPAQEELKKRLDQWDQTMQSNEQKIRENKHAIAAHSFNKAARIAQIDQLFQQIKVLEVREAPPASLLRHLNSSFSPYSDALTENIEKLTDISKEVGDLNYSVELLKRELSQLNWLRDASYKMRGIQTESVAYKLQTQTNDYLEKHFDAALRIKLEIKDADKLNIEITNEGNVSSFSQLSGGERCMLKLAFSISLMQAAQNKAGVSFNLIMLDEALHGMDTELKIKSFALLQELSKTHESILLVDHCEEFKHMFDSKYLVTKVNGDSRISLDE